MSHDFVTALQLQLREAAEREERRGALRRALAPRPVLAGAVAVVLLLALVAVVGGLQWGDRAERQAAPRVVANLPLSSSLGPVGRGLRRGLGGRRPGTAGCCASTRARGASCSVRSASPGRSCVGAGAGAVWVLDGERPARPRRSAHEPGHRAPVQVIDELARRGVEATLPVAIEIADDVPWLRDRPGRAAPRPRDGQGRRLHQAARRGRALRHARRGRLSGCSRATRGCCATTSTAAAARRSCPVRLQDASGVVPTTLGPVLVDDRRPDRARVAHRRQARLDPPGVGGLHRARLADRRRAVDPRRRRREPRPHDRARPRDGRDAVRDALAGVRRGGRRPRRRRAVDHDPDRKGDGDRR